MILLNKTMMCGGLVVLSPGSPSQVVCAILIMMFHMLLVLKLAPYTNNSEDWSSFSSSLGLTLTYVGALVQMLQARQREEFDPEELSYAGIAMDALPVMCVSIVVVIMVFVDCGLWNFLRRKRGKSSKLRGGNSGTSSTQVLPIEELKVAVDGPGKKKVMVEESEMAVDGPGEKKVVVKQVDIDDVESFKNWGKQSIGNKIAVRMPVPLLDMPITSRKQLKEVKKKFGTHSLEYKTALKQLGQQRKATLSA